MTIKAACGSDRTGGKTTLSGNEKTAFAQTAYYAKEYEHLRIPEWLWQFVDLSGLLKMTLPGRALSGRRNSPPQEAVE